MLLSGAWVDHEAGLQSGLVNRVVPPDRLLSAAETLAFTMMSRNPLAIRLAKAAIRRGSELPLNEGLQSKPFHSTPAGAGPDHATPPRQSLQAPETFVNTANFLTIPATIVPDQEIVVFGDHRQTYQDTTTRVRGLPLHSPSWESHRAMPWRCSTPTRRAISRPISPPHC